MKGISPVVPGLVSQEIILAKDQPPYLPLPALPLRDPHASEPTYLVTRWRFSWRERIKVLFRGDVYLWIWTLGRAVQPVALEIDPPAVTPDET